MLDELTSGSLTADEVAGKNFDREGVAGGDLRGDAACFAGENRGEGDGTRTGDGARASRRVNGWSTSMSTIVVGT